MAKNEFRTYPSDETIALINSLVENEYKGKKQDFLEAATRCLVNKVEDVSDLELTEAENEIVEQALKNSGLTKKQLMKRGLLAEAKRENSIFERRQNLSELKPSDLKRQTVRGVAAIHIEKAVKEIMNHNDYAGTNPEDRIFINQRVVAERSGSNMPAIKKYFEEHQSEIDAHNSKHELTSNKREKGYKFDVNAILGVKN